MYFCNAYFYLPNLERQYATCHVYDFTDREMLFYFTIKQILFYVPNKYKEKGLSIRHKKYKSFISIF